MLSYLGMLPAILPLAKSKGSLLLGHHFSGKRYHHKKASHTKYSAPPVTSNEPDRTLIAPETISLT